MNEDEIKIGALLSKFLKTNNLEPLIAVNTQII